MKRKIGSLVVAAALAVLMVPAVAFGAPGWSGHGFGGHGAWRGADQPFLSLCSLARQALTVADADVSQGPWASGVDEGAAADDSASGLSATAPCPTCLGSCEGFVDADGDGICDRWGSGPCADHDGCPGYVDADGDGICDHYGNGCPQVGSDWGAPGNGSGVGAADGSGAGSGYGYGAHHGGGHGFGAGCGNGGHGRCWR